VSVIRQEFAVATFINQLVWWLFFTSPFSFIYAADALSRTDAPSEDVALQSAAALLASLLIAVGTLYWRKRALVTPIQAGEIDLSIPEDQGRAFTPYVLNIVLSAAVAVFGIALTLRSSVSGYAYAFGVASMILMYVHRPNAPDLEPPESGKHSDLG